MDPNLNAWQEFVEHHKIVDGVNPFVANSWNRCRMRLNPLNKETTKRLNPEHLLVSQVASFDMISVARPVMEDIYQFIEGSHSIVALANSAGFILDALGDPGMLEVAGRYEITPGTSMSETEMGTNAFALSLIEKIPMRVVGPEHFLQTFHSLAEAAAPIFDLSGRSIGSLGVITSVRHHHAHTLGLVVAGARAIEGQRQADYLLTEQNRHLAQLNAILAANSEGILVWDSGLVTMHANKAAASILGLPVHVLVGRPVSEFIRYPQFIQNAIEQRKAITDVEINLNVGGDTIGCVISLRYALNERELEWIVVTLRQPEEVRQLVHRQLGAYASLTLDDLPGNSPAMRHVHRIVRSAAPAQASILIRGENGTGKNPVASAVHNASTRQDGPFLIFACASVPSELVLEELVGYEEGMSVRLPGGRPSKFELAHGGTLYFQDVEALPLEAQNILLNVLDLGIVQRLGSNRPIQVDVRIIASSSANLEELIARGNFRSDLFYRLSAFEIRMPPLRERKEDLPVLLDRTVELLARQLGHSLVVEPDALSVLMKYSWPGNIRELEAVIGRAAAHSGFSGRIAAGHLPDYMRLLRHGSSHIIGDPKVPSLEELNREAIIRAASLCQGNATEMARILGIGRTTVWRKLKMYNISLDDFRNSHVSK